MLIIPAAGQNVNRFFWKEDACAGAKKPIYYRKKKKAGKGMKDLLNAVRIVLGVVCVAGAFLIAAFAGGGAGGQTAPPAFDGTAPSAAGEGPQT